MNERIRELAHQAAMKWMPEKEPDNMQVIALMAHIEIAIKAAVLVERIDCAKVAKAKAAKQQELADETMDDDCDEGEAYEHCAALLSDVADAIRARGEP